MVGVEREDLRDAIHRGFLVGGKDRRLIEEIQIARARARALRRNDEADRRVLDIDGDHVAAVCCGGDGGACAGRLLRHLRGIGRGCAGGEEMRPPAPGQLVGEQPCAVRLQKLDIGGARPQGDAGCAELASVSRVISSAPTSAPHPAAAASASGVASNTRSISVNTASPPNKASMSVRD